MRKDPRKNILKGAQKRARLRGRPCSIKLEDIVVPSICPVLGISMEPVVGAAANENSPSLDEIVVGKGYVTGNVQVISRKANTMKSNATPEELIMFAEWILKTYA